MPLVFLPRKTEFLGGSMKNLKRGERFRQAKSAFCKFLSSGAREALPEHSDFSKGGK